MMQRSRTSGLVIQPAQDNAMIAFTPDRGQRPVADEEAVRAEFGEFDSHFMLVNDEGDSLLATGQGFGPYVIEWFPAERNGRHLRLSENLKQSEVLDVMLDFFRGKADWREGRDCQEVADEQPGWLDRLFLGLRS